MKNIIVLLIVILSFSSCKKEQYFEATVLERSYCDKVLLQFDNSLADIGESDSNTYRSNELSAKMNIIGSKILVKYRIPKNDEIFNCPTIGVSYRQIFVTEITN